MGIQLVDSHPPNWPSSYTNGVGSAGGYRGNDGQWVQPPNTNADQPGSAGSGQIYGGGGGGCGTFEDAHSGGAGALKLIW